MSISYLSHPIESKVKPYTENVGLIAQVANQKQNKYDQVLSTIFQKQNQLLALDTSQGSEEAEQRKDNLLKEADNQLNKMASSDLTIPDNISKVENIFSPIINDKDVMGAASITAFTKEQAAYFDEWKKDGKGLYDAKNEAYFLEQVQKNRKMTLQEVKEKGYKQPTSVEFVDIDKWYRDSVKELLPDVTSVIAPDGQGRIFYQNGKKLSENDILQMLPTNTKIIAQAEINAHYTLQDVKPTELLSIQQKSLLQEQASVKALVDDSEKQVGYLKNQIDEIQKNSIDGQKLVANSNMTSAQLIQELKDKVKGYNDVKTQYEKNYKEYDSKINAFNATYQFNNGIFNKQLTEDELKNLKTSTWLNSKKQQFANAMAYKEETIKVEYDQVQMEELKHQHGLEDKAVDAIYKKQEEDYKNSKDPTKNGTYTLDTDGDGVPDAGKDAILKAFGVTTSDTNQEVLKLEDGKEYKQLSEAFLIPYNDIQKVPDQTIKELSRIEPGKYNVKQTKTSREQLKKDETEYLARLKEFENDPNINSATKLPNSEQTYGAFFQDKKNIIIGNYVVKKDKALNEVHANNSMLATIQAKADEKAKPLLGNQKLNVPIKVNQTVSEKNPTNSDSRYGLGYSTKVKTVTIPASLSDKYLKGNLTDKDIKEIADFNKEHYDVTEEDTKSIIKEGTPENDNYSKYKKEFEYQKNEFAKQYAQGYKLPGLYIKDPETAKSVGKAIETNLRYYIKSNADLSVKYGNKDIRIRKVYKDADSPSGWSAAFNAFGTTTIDGMTIKKDVETDPINLTPQLVEELHLNTVYDVTEVEKNLNQQLLGDKTQDPIYMYNYLGKSYKFVMDNKTKIVSLYENSKYIREGEINNLIESIQLERANKFNK